MGICTEEVFAAFIATMKERSAGYTIFITMYYTGIWEGELLALTPSDIDFDKDTLTINESYQRLGARILSHLLRPQKSNRVVMLPEMLKTILHTYMDKCYGLQPDNHLFSFTESFLYREMQYGIKKIRAHDIRHSHASFPVDMGSSPLLIAEHLGHERVQCSQFLANKKQESRKALQYQGSLGLGYT